ncbi:phosphorylated adapter RNA export protein [Euwallacea fornicatus]|uniref:phosphorylated adapter RNA export protein n=1 Tax=Euwallacea fornicatus TaxID=995702 RepID=UPI00338FA089
MEQDENQLEEGEIEDDVDGETLETYVPLKRPETYALDAPQKRFHEVSTAYSESEEDVQSSESEDSDSDAGTRKNKRPKRIKPIPKLQKERSDILKKYDIWSTRAQEDVLAETMVSCDVSLKDRSRQSENYDFSLARKYYDELENGQGTKRSRDDMKNKDFKLRRKSPSQENNCKGIPKEIPDLSVDEVNDTNDIVKDIADKLNEKRDDLILKVVQAMGKERTIEFFKETQHIERDGGMPIKNQTRRRTPGGVFFYLVRTDYYITPEQRRDIFAEDKQLHKKMIQEEKKQKLRELKASTKADRDKILPDLLTRAEQLAKENPIRTLKNTNADEDNCTNPPPSPETDHHESGDGMESQPLPVEPVSANKSLNSNVDERDILKTYDDDFLEITCDNDMDFF